MDWILVFLAPFILIIAAWTLNRMGLRLKPQWLKWLELLLILATLLGLSGLLLNYFNWGRWRWPLLVASMQGLSLLLIVIIYSLGKQHFNKFRYLLYKTLQIIPIGLAVAMMIPVLNLHIVGSISDQPQTYYRDDKIVIQSKYEGILSKARPPRIYRFKYGLFLQDLHLSALCSEAADSVRVQKEGSQYQIRFYGSWINESRAPGHLKERACQFTFDLDTL